MNDHKSICHFPGGTPYTVTTEPIDGINRYRIHTEDFGPVTGWAASRATTRTAPAAIVSSATATLRPTRSSI